MKSKKVEVYMKSLSPEVFPKIVGRPEAIRVAEIAEEEAEERVRAELTRWHSTKKAQPANDREVLCKIDNLGNTYAILKHNNLGWWMPASKHIGWCACPFEVLAWREIHE